MNHQLSKVLMTEVEKMMPSAARASCLCNREIWSMANSRSALIAARSICSGLGQDGHSSERRSPLTRRWSKPDSNSRSHPACPAACAEKRSRLGLRVGPGSNMG